MPSQFLDEIDPDFVERRSLQAPSTSRPAAGVGGARDAWDRGRGFSPARSVRPSRAESTPPARDFFPSYEDESQASAHLEPGMRVRHPSWGEAVIEAVEGSGDRLKLTLRFRGGVLKKVLAVYAKLELLA
jgi:hypothetical protein